MKSLKKFLMLLPLILIYLFSSLAFVACGGDKGAKEGEIYIMYFEGGFGSEWLINATQRFAEKNPGVTFRLEKDADLRQNAPMLLQAGENLPDIIMSQDFNWMENVQNGDIADLDDIYNKKVAEVDGQDVLLKDFIADEYKNYPWTPAIPGLETKHAWIIPWSANTVSLAYNEDLLKKTQKTDGTFWIEPPKTTQELKQLVNDINATSASGGYGGKDVKPFVWPGKAVNWLTFLQTTWWAQYQGVGEDSPQGQGNWYSFWEFESPEVFLQEGLIRSYDMLRELFVDTARKTWANVPEGIGALETTEAEIEFIKGASVMMPVGSWLEKEMANYLDAEYAYPNMRQHLRMMLLPNIEGARSQNINNAQVGDFMCVPEKAVNKQLAKEFLLFISQEEEMLEFTKTTGMMRPFKYNPIEKLPDHEWSKFQLDTLNMYLNHTNFYQYSKNESPFYVFKKLTPYYPTIATPIGGLLENDGQTVAQNVYNSVAVLWDQWKLELGMA